MLLTGAVLTGAGAAGAQQTPPYAAESSPRATQDTLAASWSAGDTARLHALVLPDGFAFATAASTAALHGHAALRALLRQIPNQRGDSLRLRSSASAQEGSAWFDQGEWVLYAQSAEVQRGRYRAQWRRIDSGAWRLAGLIWAGARQGSR